MSEEVREIIDEFKDVVEDNSTMYSREITIKEAKVLLDYITNLQEENEKLKDLYRRTIDHLFKIGNDELARYFQAQINDCPSFVPQDIRGDE